MEFTDKEIEMLSNGLLSLIHNAVKAQKLITDTAVSDDIQKYINKVQGLNEKICRN